MRTATVILIAALALAVLLSAAAVAQVHGVPASVTSITNTRWGQTPGVPASVLTIPSGVIFRIV